jgi:hydroxypyruvate reductase
VTLAISDVVGDDLTVIGSGPGVPDPSTWGDVVTVLAQLPETEFPAAVSSRVADGVAGKLEETPKPGDPRLVRTVSCVIAGRSDLLDGARRTAESLGYTVVMIPEPVTGEAREAAQAWFRQATSLAQRARPPVCVISGGETTVHVRGSGRGGRNQEFTLSLVEPIAASSSAVLVASVGTDGIDGPTDAAGAHASVTTLARARQLGLSPAIFLNNNDAFNFFNPLGDLIRLGRTDTNVGDLQVYLSGGTLDAQAL